MDRNTILAVVLSAIVTLLGFALINYFFGPKPTDQQTEIVSETQPISEKPEMLSEMIAPSGTEILISDETEQGPEASVINERTNVYDITFSTAGAVIESLKLLHHLDKDKPIDMIFSGDSGEKAFAITIGEFDGMPLLSNFDVSERIHDANGNLDRIVFRQTFKTAFDQEFTIKKEYSFKPDEYLFELRISIQNGKVLNANGKSYTVSFGPQIGPEFDNLNTRYEYRKFYTYYGDKKRSPKLSANLYRTTERVNWASIIGKYFTMIGIPGSAVEESIFSSKPVDGVPATSKFFFVREEIKSMDIEDLYRFYAGPKTADTLSRFNKAEDNEFGISGLNLNAALDTNILGWLEWILGKILFIFYALVKNYGIAIIMLTVLIKIVLYPITHKSYESTSKMQALSPKIAELKEKYKNNSQKMNLEMAALYKREGVSPLGGCLPMLLQLPIFFAFYGLLSKQFELRGSPFFGWINDLSAPESVYSFYPASIPILGWSDIRLLPIIYIVTQIITQKFMQNPGASTNNSMKIMTWGLPIFFFFILYNAPSGLILYWTITNVLTFVQQILVTKYRKRKKQQT